MKVNLSDDAFDLIYWNEDLKFYAKVICEELVNNNSERAETFVEIIQEDSKGKISVTYDEADESILYITLSGFSDDAIYDFSKCHDILEDQDLFQ